MFPIRPNEPDYALLKDPACQSHNRYGLSIETVPEGNPLRGASLNINGDAAIGANPNRYQQHGFFFNADNCIGCHACESACSEKNDLPPHLAFRSVGFVEGGSYPNTQRLNISMACNHCDDPVKGQVSKCNMCVDRLEVGLKPACAAACLGKALDFGVIENIPEGRSQAKTEIPGFPRTDITHPNIRFQQTRVTQRDMRRVDSTPLKYHRDDASGRFAPELDPKHGFQRQWNLKKLLGSHENAHIAFTLSVQAVMGAFLLLVLGGWLGLAAVLEFSASSAWLPTLGTMLALASFGLFRLNMHLGKPLRFYRGFNNWRLSPVSREIAGVSLFFGGLAGFAFFNLFPGFPLAALLKPASAAAGLAGLGFGGYYMIKLYRIEARPFWNHWHTNAAFVGTAASLGGLLLALLALAFGALSAELARLLAVSVCLGLTLEGIGLLAHARALTAARSEGVASFYEQTTTYGYPYWLRNGLLGAGLLVALSIALGGNPSLFVPLALITVAAAILGRALFYVLVIPTTMPGAFFWRNKGFVEHARETGLANMPQLGVIPDTH